ncbi:MAG: type II secretion system protein [Kiritimatiellae bacterium]|jgi:prepilin-type N-terminal cleavage/methylation domain-containing protein|nr:type II secretion system protein [Kiritimatiellia bacterium]
MKNLRSRKAFTIMEMLVVVAVMAIIATLATSAVLKSVRTMRYKRINATISGLQMALQNYRAQHNEWPFSISAFEQVDNSPTYYVAEGENNAEVFEELFKTDNTTYIDPSAILTRVNGSRMSVKQALEKGESLLPLGYPDPVDTRKFSFFTVHYNLETDSVKVSKP